MKLHDSDRNNQTKFQVISHSLNFEYYPNPPLAHQSEFH